MIVETTMILRPFVGENKEDVELEFWDGVTEPYIARMSRSCAMQMVEALGKTYEETVREQRDKQFEESANDPNWRRVSIIMEGE